MHSTLGFHRHYWENFHHPGYSLQWSSVQNCLPSHSILTPLRKSAHTPFSELLTPWPHWVGSGPHGLSNVLTKAGQSDPPSLVFVIQTQKFQWLLPLWWYGLRGRVPWWIIYFLPCIKRRKETETERDRETWIKQIPGEKQRERKRRWERTRERKRRRETQREKCRDWDRLANSIPNSISVPDSKPQETSSTSGLCSLRHTPLYPPNGFWFNEIGFNGWLLPATTHTG